MRRVGILLIVVLISSFQLETKAQNNNEMIQDSMIWHIYIPGRPDMNYLNTQKAVAQKWGVKVDYLFGDCVGTMDEKGKAYEADNQIIFDYFSEKFGNDWEAKFEEEVQIQLQKK